MKCEGQGNHMIGRRKNMYSSDLDSWRVGGATGMRDSGSAAQGGAEHEQQMALSMRDCRWTRTHRERACGSQQRCTGT